VATTTATKPARRATIGLACRSGLLVVIASAALLGAPGSAQATSLPTTITSNQTWTAGDSPYTGSSVTINSGVTVTVEPGVTVQLSGTLTVNGTLNAQGTSADPITFTSTNDAYSATWVSRWGGVIFNSSTGSILDHVYVRYAANSVQINDSSPQITNSTFRANSYYGIGASGASAPTIANNTIIDNRYSGIYLGFSGTGASEVRVHDNVVERNAGYGIAVNASTTNSNVVGITLRDNIVRDNTNAAFHYQVDADDPLPADIDENPLPTGNAGNYIQLRGAIAQSTSWENRGYPMVIGGNLTVASGATLTLSPGFVIKGTSSIYALTVNGTLNAQGTSADPITFTSTNDAYSATWVSRWGGVIFNSSTGSILDHVYVRYAANSVQINDSSPQITNSTFRANSYYGIGASGASAPTIANNTIIDNRYSGIYLGFSGTGASEVRVHDNVVERNAGYGIAVNASTTNSNVVGITLRDNIVRDNTNAAFHYQVDADDPLPADIDENPLPTGNAGNYIQLRGAIAHSTSWENRGYPMVIGGNLTVASGATLTLSPGFVIKGTSSIYALVVKGAVNAQGTTDQPIIFTSIKDNSVGGITGSGSPAPGDWWGLNFKADATSSGTGTFDHVQLRYGGFTYQAKAMIEIECPCPTPPTFRHATIEKSNRAVNILGNPGSAEPIIARSKVRSNNYWAVWKGGNSVTRMPYVHWGSDSGPAPLGSGNSIGPVNLVDVTPTVGSDENKCQGSEKKDCGHDADPVSLAIGAFTYSHRDLFLTSKGAPLEFTRSYNSGDASDAGLGPGWSHTGLIRVTEHESGDVLVRRADGRGDLYTKDGSSYTPPSGIHDVLEKEGDGTFKLTTLDRVVYDFDVSARIATITDDHGLTTSYGYNANGRLTTITDPSGQALTFTYNASNHITKAADSTGREVNYTYNGAGDLTTVTDPLNGVTSYAYDSQHRLTSMTDPRNVTFLTNTYDSQGRVVEQRDGENNLWTLEYGPGETTVTQPEGGSRSYSFDSQQRVIQMTDEVGNQTSYDYDANGNVVHVTRPGGAEWSFDYDSAGNLTSATDPMGGTQTITYNGDNHPTSFTDPRLETWTYTWTGDDLTKITDAATGETEFTYDAAGQPLTVTDPNDHTTELAYDTRGNLTSRTDPLDHTTTYGYNTRNYLISKTEPGKPAEAYARNGLGDLLSVTTPEGNTTSYEYDGNGAPIEITDPALKVWTIERDGMERATAYVDPLNNRTEIAYDGNLNPISVTDRRDKTTTYTYDLANRLTTIELPEGGTSEFGYDARGNRTQVTDPRDNITAFEYDLNDRVVEANEPLSTTTAYGYDAAGNLTQITDPRSNQTTFSYDALGRMTGISQPLAKTTGFIYDPAGNLVSRVTQEGTLTYSYDTADRLTGISDGTNNLRGFAYDAADRMTEATDAQAKALAIGYDDDDHVTSLDDDRGQTVALTYDARGNLTQQVDGRGTVQYAYDDLSRITSLTDPQSGMLDFTHDPEGNLTGSELPNGVVTTNTYDGNGRMTNTTSEKASNILQSFAYTYDAAGNRTAQTDRNNDTTTYAYDALNRLTEFDPPGGPAAAYGYDAAGNRTSANGLTYTFNALNQLAGSSDGTTYGYDDAGRLIERANGSQTTTFGWDPLDELTEVDDGQNPVSYSYDALGRRSERSEGTDTTTAHYGDLADRRILETDETPSITRSYVQGPEGMLVEERSGSATTYPLTDAHGDVTTVTDDAGAVVSRQEYDPWGIQLSGPDLENGYLGAYQRPTDPDTGLLQMGIRPYDPTLGQFLEEDHVLGAMGFGQSLNRYPYVWNNPLTRYDLSGLFWDELLPDKVCTPLPGIKGCVGEDGVQACIGADPLGIASACADDDGVSADFCTPSFGGSGPSYCTDPERLASFVKDNCLWFGLAFDLGAVGLRVASWVAGALGKAISGSLGIASGASAFAGLGAHTCHLVQEGEL
jgi:RHS repeat-associated protein